MKISPATKVNDLINEYPFIKEFLVKLNPHFKALDNPIMRKTLGRMATLGKVSMIGGIEIGELLKGIAGEIKGKAGTVVEVESLAGQEPISDPEQRLEALRQIIEDLHKGEDMKVLKQRLMLHVKQ